MLSVIWILALLIGVYWYLTVILICISLIIYDDEHLFICLFIIFAGGIFSEVLCIFKIELFAFLSLSFKSSLYI